jgi:hypothetical protein
LELYHEVVWLGRTQAEVADQFGVSQPRAATVCQQVREWVDETVPADFAEQCAKAILAAPAPDASDENRARPLTPPENSANPTADRRQTVARELTNPGHRLHLALSVLRFRLTPAYAKYLDCFGGQRAAADLAPIVAAWKEGRLAKEIADLLPRRDLVESAVQMALELDELAGLALRGPFFHLPQQQREMEPQRPELASAARADDSGPGQIGASGAVSSCLPNDGALGSELGPVEAI